MYHGEEVPLKFFEARREPTHVFHAAKEALDDVAHGVKVGGVWDRISRIAF